MEPVVIDEVRSLLARLDREQRLWLSGYLAGASRTPSVAIPQSESAPSNVVILYGSQSGNSQHLAERVNSALTQRGVMASLVDMIDCRKSHFESARTLLVIVSTHGDGDPPDRAMGLYELLHGPKAPNLAHLKYAVLALGDSSYEKFCETGRQFDQRLQSLGGQRLHGRVECDIDFEAPAQQWIETVVGLLADSGATNTLSEVVPIDRLRVIHSYSKKNPLLAPVLINQRLTASHSTKNVRHIELSLDGANLRYEPGDAIGVVVANRDSDVTRVLAILGCDPGQQLDVGPVTMSALEAFRDCYDIGQITRPFLIKYAAAVTSDELNRLCADDAGLKSYLLTHHLMDLLHQFPPKGLDAVDLLKMLRPLSPRLYSIASSQRATPDEVHLTVAVVQYRLLGSDRHGLASGYLGKAGQSGANDEAVRIYLHRNPNFRLPTDHGRPIIMIGPGTGVAPFRSFIAEREALGGKGRNWLFFGDRSFNSDFLYQSDWLAWRKSGVLSRIDVAFSRDGDEKAYVQHRMHEQGKALFAWLEEGASLYVCGDAEHMAPDVNRALLEIIAKHGGRAPDKAQEYLLELQRQRRYQRDVY